MKFAVGYQPPGDAEEPFTGIVRDFRGRIAEVYFPWLDLPSGRSPMTARDGFRDWRGQERLEEDLRAIKGMGVGLDLLLNANCWGGRSLSRQLANLVRSIVAHLCEDVGLDVVTTASPMVARTVKEHFPGLEVRASVNMRIGTVEAMEYVADYFDAFHIQREYNRDLARVRELAGWAAERGKKVSILANSGCLAFCSGQTFHDNLVAHEEEISAAANVEGWNPCICWEYYRNPAHWVRFLRNTWIRPEDIGRYEGLVPLVKLATRAHDNPRRVVRAYCEGRYRGNLPDLLEPGHGPLFAGRVFDNARFPEDWFETTSACGRRCNGCSYCRSVLERVLVSLPGDGQPLP